MLFALKEFNMVKYASMLMTGSGRRLAAIMFTDIVGYTALSQKDEPLALSLLEEHRTLLRPLFQTHGGNEIKTIGDSFLIEFDSALEAVRCAVSIEKSLHDFNGLRAATSKILVRIGIHVGDVIHSGGDIYGDAVNIASRIQSIAEPGGICITQQVCDQVQNKIDVHLSDIGKRNLKNIEEPLEIYRVLLPWNEALASEHISRDRRRLAVMPLVSMSPDPADSYFADGMTEELISTLSTVSRLRVVSRTSVMGYKNNTKKVGEIAKDLDVGTIIEGSVRKVGNKVRITIQLIDAVIDEHSWVANYDRELVDVFAIQSDVAKQVAAALSVKIAESEQKRLSKIKTSSTSAYQDYLIGQSFRYGASEREIRQAITYFERALKEDPNFAQAHSALAGAYDLLGHHSHIGYAESYKLAKSELDKALAIEPDLSEAHAFLGSLLDNYEWKFLDAEKEYKKAIILNPSESLAHRFYARCLATIGRIEEAVDQAEIAVEQDPLDPACLNLRGMMYLLAGREQEALSVWLNAIHLFPKNSGLRFFISIFLLVNERFEEAEKQLASLGSEEIQEPLNKLLLGYLFAKTGKRNDALKLIDELKLLCNEGFASEDHVAFVYAGLENKEEFFKWMDKAVILHHAEPFVLKNHSKIFPKEFSNDPRWEILLASAHLL